MRLKSYYQSAVNVRVRFFMLSAFVGVVAGFATLGLIGLIALVQEGVFGSMSEVRFASVVAGSPTWLVLLTPAIGGLIVGALLHFMQGQRYHGIADVMEACAVRGARMDVRSGVGAAFAAAISMGSGAPVGREGPAVHIGASISAWLAERLGLTQSDSLTLLGCGAAAAVTASFNAPIAGVLFALEVVVGYYTMRVFAPIVVASAASVIVRQSVLGGDAVFSLPHFQLNSFWELPIFGLLGLFCALFVLVLILLVGKIQDFWQASKAPLWCRPALGGLLIGAIAIRFPDVLGSGYQSIDQSLNQELLPTLLMVLLVMRFLGTGIALGSGFAGGVFTPSLVFGALLGALIWTLVSALLPDLVSEHGVYSIVGMGALASAMLGAPISTVLIVFELTANYEVTIAVMLAAAMASTLMQLSPHTSFFRWQLARRGVNITSGRDQSLLRTRTVENLVKQDFSPVGDGDKIIDVERQLSTDKNRIAILLDEDGNLLGSANLRRLVAASIDHGFDTPAAEILFGSEKSISQHTNLVVALQEMAEQNIDYMPVVESRDTERFLFKGVVFRTDLLKNYYDVLRTARAEEFGIN
ncbi:MAG: chloride channel protein [Gammaproteobacteria bacterium]|nr:chloride channel protein [Gammaproteobacteria bacterium]